MITDNNAIDDKVEGVPTPGFLSRIGGYGRKRLYESLQYAGISAVAIVATVAGTGKGANADTVISLTNDLVTSSTTYDTAGGRYSGWWT